MEGWKSVCQGPGEKRCYNKSCFFGCWKASRRSWCKQRFFRGVELLLNDEIAGPWGRTFFTSF